MVYNGTTCVQPPTYDLPITQKREWMNAIENTIVALVIVWRNNYSIVINGRMHDMQIDFNAQYQVLMI